MNKFPERFADYIKDNALVEDDQKILVAVSGGVDSMALLYLLSDAGYDIAVAHCNFQLRGEESYEDEILVKEVCENLGVPFYNMRFDTAGEMDRTGESVQVAARRLRYGWFSELTVEHGYTATAIAHHADDSIETFFINLFRGTGLKGLTGISLTNGKVIRPLLFATRKEILDYANFRKIPFREDSTNRSTKYLRNKIRLGLIPRIREISPGFTRTMGTNIGRLTMAQNFVDHGISLVRKEVETVRDGMVVIDPSKIDRGFPVDYVLYELLRKYGFKGDTVDGLCRTLSGGQSGKMFYSRDYLAYTDRGQIIITPISVHDPCPVHITPAERKAYCGNSVLYFDVIDIDHIDNLKQPANIALLDADKVGYPLLARRWQDGDSLIPYGMDGRKKVSDLLVDEKVSLAEKSRQFVLVSGDDIVWVIGRRIDDRYKIDEKTENVLRITRETV